MALTVNTNMAAMSAANSLNSTQGSLAETLGRVSSGLRITKAADDAAGAAVAQNLSTQARSGRQAIRNANDGISVIQTAEAATKEVLSILDRLRELAVQSSSDTLDDDEREYIETEGDELELEIERIAQVSSFNGTDLANNATGTKLAVQVGLDKTSNSQIDITLQNLTLGSTGLNISAIALDASSTARAAIETIDTAIDSVNKARAAYGATQNRLDSAISNMSSYVEALSAAASRIEDADYAHETAEMTRLQVMQQAGVAALGQARGMNQAVLSLL